MADSQAGRTDDVGGCRSAWLECLGCDWIGYRPSSEKGQRQSGLEMAKRPMQRRDLQRRILRRELKHDRQLAHADFLEAIEVLSYAWRHPEWGVRSGYERTAWAHLIQVAARKSDA